MHAYHVNHITSSPHYPQSNGLDDKYVQIIRSLFWKAKEGVKIYSNAWLSTAIHLLVAACNHQCKSCKAEVQDLVCPCLTQLDISLVYSLKSLEMLIRMHICLHMTYILKQEVMYQDAASKWWYPATITSLCAQPRSYNITTREAITYRKTQAHLKPYQLQSKK